MVVKQQRRDWGDLSERDLEQHAEDWFREYIEVPPESSPLFVKVSTSEKYPRSFSCFYLRYSRHLIINMSRAT